MEFNDSRVSDYKFENLDNDVTGEDSKTTTYSAYGTSWSSGGTTYGKSAYMLFYERRKKKDIKIVVPENEIAQEKKKGIQVNFDEEKKEYSKQIKYRDGTENEKPNEIYKRVFEDNGKFTFESDIYSPEFFEFILQVLTGVTEINE